MQTEESSSEGETVQPWPCKLDESGKVHPCAGLSEILEDPHGRGTRSQGIVARFMVNTNTMEAAGTLIVIKSGKHSKKGLIANHCPICGEWINKYGEAPALSKASEPRI